MQCFKARSDKLPYSNRCAATERPLRLTLESW
jgi:hypothetical protein